MSRSIARLEPWQISGAVVCRLEPWQISGADVCSARAVADFHLVLLMCARQSLLVVWRIETKHEIVHLFETYTFRFVIFLTSNRSTETRFDAAAQKIFSSRSFLTIGMLFSTRMTASKITDERFQKERIELIKKLTNNDNWAYMCEPLLA